MNKQCQFLFCIISLSLSTAEKDIYTDGNIFHKFQELTNIIPTNISPNKSICIEAWNNILINAASLKIGALKVLDSWGKVPSGILQGNIIQFGNFDQCVNSGNKYCLTSIEFKIDNRILNSLIYSHHALRSSISDPGHRVPRFSSIQWGICTPEVCTSSEMEEIIKHNLKRTFLSSSVVKIESNMCQSYQNLPKGYSTLLALIFFLLIISLSLISTFCELSTLNKEVKDVIKSFSWRKNWEKLTNTKNTADEIACLDGIRFLSAVSLLLSHKQMALMFLPYINRTYMAELTGKAWTTIGRTAIIHTDTFIFLSGFLTTKTILKDLNKNGEINIRRSIISRIFRITPNLFAMIIFCTWVLPVLNWGPLWPQVINTYSELCRKNFWRNILFIHNFYPFQEMCLTHTHQLGIDMQLYLLSLVLIYTLWKWRKNGVILLILLGLISTILRYINVVNYKLSTVIHFGISIDRLMKTADYSYIRPMHRLTVYVMGILFGYYLHENKSTKIILSKVQIFIGWIIFTSCGILAVVGPYFFGQIDYEYNEIHAAVYTSFSPIIWIAFVSWSIFCCLNGYAGWFGALLSFSKFKMFTKISYAVYLTQFPIFFYNVGTTMTSKYYSSFDLFNFWELLSVLLSSLLLTMIFDLPFQNIYKVLWPNKICQKQKKAVKEDQEEVVLNNNNFGEVRERLTRHPG